MDHDRYRRFIKPITWTYAFSFIMPVGSVGFPGILSLIFSALLGLTTLQPALLIGVAANPLGLFGLMALRQKDYRSAARFGLPAFLATIAPIPFVVSIFESWSEHSFLLALLNVSGYLAWAGSFLAIAVVGVLAASTDESGRLRLQISIKMILLVIALLAVALACRHALLAVLYWSNVPKGGSFMMG